MKVVLNRITKDTEITQLAALADEVWHQHFSTILSSDQIDYMLEKFQSFTAMKDQMLHNGYEYYFITVNEQAVGYTGIKNDNGKLFLSKLYILKRYRGNGYASEVMNQLKQMAVSRKLQSIWLTVNRFNLDTIAIYKKLGLTIIKEQVSDIGKGYVMDDYVMEVEF